MKRKTLFCMTLILFLILTGCGRRNDGIVRQDWSHTYDGYPVVYVSPEVSAQGLAAAYKALEASGSAAIKLSDTKTDANFVWEDLTGELFQILNDPAVIEANPAENLTGYDYTVVLSHFRSHSTVGFNGSIKQTAAISVPLAQCLAYGQDPLRLLAENSKRTVENLDGRILYINVMDRLSIESSGITLPDSNQYAIGILASYDPVALDQA